MAIQGHCLPLARRNKISQWRNFQIPLAGLLCFKFFGKILQFLYKSTDAVQQCSQHLCKVIESSIDISVWFNLRNQRIIPVCQYDYSDWGLFI